LPDCTEAQKPSGNGGGGAVDQPLPGEEIDDSERPILYKLRTPSERKFLDGYAPHFQPDLSWERPRPDPRVSERSTHDSIANCIVSSTSIVLKKLDELRRLVSETGTELEIEILGIKLRVDLLICSLSLALVIVLTIQFQLARWNAEIQIELLRTEIEDGLSAIKKCACGRRGCDGGCGH
jgi:hypothetical protein